MQTKIYMLKKKKMFKLANSKAHSFIRFIKLLKATIFCNDENKKCYKDFENLAYMLIFKICMQIYI